MYIYLVLLILCLAAQRARSKSLFDYNVNPEYDLLAEESKSYSNFWQGSELNSPTHKRYKHFAKPGHGRGYGGHPSHSFDYPDHQHHHFPQSTEEFGDYDYPQNHHQHHGFPPGQAKKHGNSGLPPGIAKKHGGNGHPHDPPRRFPPPPVYDKDFIDPWAVQQPPLTTPAAVYVAPRLTTSTTPATVYIAPRLTTSTTPAAVYIAPRLTSTTTTPSPIASTTSDDQLLYDIDVRFGRD